MQDRKEIMPENDNLYQRVNLRKAAQILQSLGRARSEAALTLFLGGQALQLPALRKAADPSRGLSASNEDWIGFGRKSQNGLKALTVLDPISDLSWSTDFSCVRLKKDDAIPVISKEDFDFLLIESLWRGVEEEWLYAATSPGLKHANAKALVEALEYTRENIDKPIVIINKEDPLHYDKFLPIMQYADHIFTTDQSMVERYRKQTKALSITAMPFAANMQLTNPVDRVREKQESVCFAGSFYSEGHEERSRQMGFILEPILEFKGAIYDRMSVHENPRYQFPERFLPYIRPAVPFEEMTSLYRRFRVFLNVNTIVTSPTMMSRRVYELLACGTPVVSAPSEALEQQFAGVVQIATTAAEALEQTARLIEDERHWWKTSQRGVREVALNHQYKHRANLIKKVVFGEASDDKKPLVSIVLSTKRWMFIDRIIKNISEQTYPRIEVIAALHEGWPEEELLKLEQKLKLSPNIERVNLRRFPDGISLGLKLNACIAEAHGEYVAKFDDDDFYFPNYLQDMVLSFDFSGADVAGKWTFPVWLEGQNKLFLRNPGHEHRISSPFVAGATLVAKREWFQKIRFSDRSQGEDSDFLKRSVAAGAKLYSSDHFNFINYRSKNVDHHTWRADEDLFVRTGKLIGTRDSFDDWIV